MCFVQHFEQVRRGSRCAENAGKIITAYLWCIHCVQPCFHFFALFYALGQTDTRYSKKCLSIFTMNAVTTQRRPEHSN